MDELSEEERAIVELVREFVDRDVRPVVRELEHANTYPEKLIEQMKQLGIFGLAIPEPWGAAPGQHAVLRAGHRGAGPRLDEPGRRDGRAHGGGQAAPGLRDRRAEGQRYLPRMATGEIRATMALTEPGGGSDLQAMRTTARRDGRFDYVVNGTKTWITNARRSQLIALLCKTDPAAAPAHAGISILLAEHGPGFTVSRDLPKLGYKGVESCELSFDDFRVPARALLGGPEGEGFAQMMRGLEIGRIQVAAARRRRRPGRAGGRAAVRPAAGELRQADLAAPVDRQLPGRHGHQADRRPPAGAVRRAPLRRRATGRTWRRAWPSCSPRRPRWRSR